jgi:hypothetical protein
MNKTKPRVLINKNLRPKLLINRNQSNTLINNNTRNQSNIGMNKSNFRINNKPNKFIGLHKNINNNIFSQYNQKQPSSNKNNIIRTIKKKNIKRIIPKKNNKKHNFSINNYQNKMNNTEDFNDNFTVSYSKESQSVIDTNISEW